MVFSCRLSEEGKERKKDRKEAGQLKGRNKDKIKKENESRELAYDTKDPTNPMQNMDE